LFHLPLTVALVDLTIDT